MTSDAQVRCFLMLLLAVTVVTALGFILVIVANVGSGVGVHEIAGLLLLILLGMALWAAYRVRPLDARPIVRVGVALGGLVSAGILGASLAAGSLSEDLAGLPLLPLAVVVIAAGDGLRITRGLRVPASEPS
jgi:hypothetical protein